MSFLLNSFWEGNKLFIIIMILALLAMTITVFPAKYLYVLWSQE